MAIGFRFVGVAMLALVITNQTANACSDNVGYLNDEQLDAIKRGDVFVSSSWTYLGGTAILPPASELFAEPSLPPGFTATDEISGPLRFASVDLSKKAQESAGKDASFNLVQIACDGSVTKLTNLL